MDKAKRTPGQPLRFLAVGAVGFAVDGGLLAIGLMAGLPAWAARIPSFLSAVLATWALNRRITFATAAAPSLREFGTYLAAMGLGLSVNYASYVAALLAGLGPLPALCIASALAMGINFLTARRVLGRP